MELAAAQVLAGDATTAWKARMRKAAVRDAAALADSVVEFHAAKLRAANDRPAAAAAAELRALTSWGEKAGRTMLHSAQRLAMWNISTA